MRPVGWQPLLDELRARLPRIAPGKVHVRWCAAPGSLEADGAGRAYEVLGSGGRAALPVLATTGELEYGKDPLPRTYGVRADGIRGARFLSNNDRGNGEPFAVWSSVPIVDLLLEE